MDRLPVPLSDTELIEIITRNLRPDIRHELLYVEVLSIPQLRKLVQRSKSFLNDEYVRRNFAPRNAYASGPRRQISEVDTEVDITNATGAEHGESSVNAIQQHDTIVKCWNCDQTGHHWEDCLQDRYIFCYGCGAKNTYKPQCSKCQLRKSKNFKQPVPPRELN